MSQQPAPSPPHNGGLATARHQCRTAEAPDGTSRTEWYAAQSCSFMTAIGTTTNPAHIRVPLCCIGPGLSQVLLAMQWFCGCYMPLNNNIARQHWSCCWQQCCTTSPLITSHQTRPPSTAPPCNPVHPHPLKPSLDRHPLPARIAMERTPTERMRASTESFSAVFEAINQGP